MAPTELSLQDLLRPKIRFSKIIWSRDGDDDDDDDDDLIAGAPNNGDKDDDDDDDDDDNDDDDDDDDDTIAGAPKNGDKDKDKDDDRDDDRDDYEKERQGSQPQPPSIPPPPPRPPPSSPPPSPPPPPSPLPPPPPAKPEQPTKPVSAPSPKPVIPPPTVQPYRLSPNSSNGSMDRSNSTLVPARVQPSSSAPSAQKSEPVKVPAGASAKSPTLMLMPPVDSSPDKPKSSLPSSPITPVPSALPTAGASNINQPDSRPISPLFGNDDEVIPTLSQLMNAPTPIPSATPFQVSTSDSVLDTIPDFQKGPSNFDLPNHDNLLPTTSCSGESAPTGAPRKEINPTSSSASSTSQTTALQRPTDPSTSSQLSHTLSPNESNNSGALSPLAEHILVALGAIGAFILLASILFFVAGIKGKNPFYPRRKIKYSRNQQSGFVELDRGRNDKPLEEPPRYSHSRGSLKLETFNDKQDILTQSSPQKYKQFEAFKTTPPSLQRSSTGRTEIIPNNPKYDLSRNTEPYMGQTESYVNPQLYGNASQPVPYEMNETINSFGSNYNNPGTLIMLDSPSAYSATPNQRISFASSISSGFGDGLILPTPTAIPTDENKPLQQNWSRPPAVSKTRLSWFNGKRRDSYLSTSSIDTAPRFRSISSWVKHQSDELNRNPRADDESLPLRAAPEIYNSSKPIPKQYER